MDMRIVLPALVMALTPSCKSVDCGPGTAERSGACVPSSETVSSAKCGPFTVLQGDTCVHSPMFPPTVCDPATTAEDTDMATGVTTCIGTGGGGCAARLPCPTPTDGTQTVCGQIFDFETNQTFSQPGAMGTRCSPGATSGPCALAIKAYDAVAFAVSMGKSPPLTTGSVYLDDCGRYQVPGIPVTGLTAPFLALGIDDADPTKPGPFGITNAVGLATGAAMNTATKEFDAYVVPKATSDKWAGMPPFDMTHGIFAPVYRAHKTGPDLQAGVMFKAATGTATTTVFYLGGTTRAAVDTLATTTAANGTALVGIAGGAPTDQYTGLGGLPPECQWELHGASSIPFAIFIQIFRPVSASGKTCTL